jgi:hypothetical protein
MKTFIATAALLIFFPMLTLAQSPSGPDRTYRGDGYLFFGLGGRSVDYIRGSSVVEHVGAGGELNLYKGFGLAAELGWAHWGYGGVEGTAWTPSADLLLHLRGNKTRGLVDPFVFAGATAYIPTEHGERGSPAVNLGGGINLWFSKHTALRLEFRDYVTGSGEFAPGANYASARVGVTFR